MGSSTSSQENSVCRDIAGEEVELNHTQTEMTSPKQRKSKLDPNRPTSELRFMSFNVRVDSILDGKDRWANRKEYVLIRYFTNYIDRLPRSY
jgi:hypothetical protein